MGGSGAGTAFCSLQFTSVREQRLGAARTRGAAEALSFSRSHSSTPGTETSWRLRASYVEGKINP